MIPQYTKRAITIGSDLIRGSSIGCPEFVCALIAVLVSSGNIQIISELYDRTSSQQAQANSSHLPKYALVHHPTLLGAVALALNPRRLRRRYSCNPLGDPISALPTRVRHNE